MRTVSAGAGELSTARERARRVCLDSGIAADRTYAVELVVSELVGNAVRHGHAPIAYAVGVDGAEVLVVVEDADPEPPALVPHQTADAEGGRGLVLVAAVSRRWGWTPLPGGKRVWARV